MKNKMTVVVDTGMMNDERYYDITMPPPESLVSAGSTDLSWRKSGKF